MEGGSVSKCASRLRASHIRLESLQQLQRWRTSGFQPVALALAPRTFVEHDSSSFKDGGRLLYKLWSSPERRAKLF
eukprot:5140454-Pyramimonas_sp.AAC.1